LKVKREEIKGKEEKKRPSPEIPIARDFPPSLFSPDGPEGKPSRQLHHAKIRFSLLLGVCCNFRVSLLYFCAAQRAIDRGFFLCG
jgi:hypothetical protein